MGVQIAPTAILLRQKPKMQRQAMTFVRESVGPCMDARNTYMQNEVAIGPVTGREYQGYWSGNDVIRGINGHAPINFDLSSVAITKVVIISHSWQLWDTADDFVHIILYVVYTVYKANFHSLWALPQLLSKVTTSWLDLHS